MTQRKTLTLLLVALALITLGVIARLSPHLPNMTPIIAIGLVAGAYLGRSYAFLVPLAALVISDFFIGMYDWRIMLSVYASFALIGGIGWIMRKFRGVQSYTLLAISGSTFFFFSTNTAVWLFSPWYEKSLTGLLYSYELGIPFWRNMLLGDILYTASLVFVCECVLVVHAYYRNRLVVA